MNDSPTAVSEIARSSGRSALDLAVLAARAASAKTLEETVLLDVGDLLGITDYFVLSAGRNDRQVRSIVDEVGRAVRDAGGTSVRRVEGLSEAQWVLVDYGSFVVHVFDIEARERFGLERLWADAPRVEWEPALAGGVAPH
jgi:ribosome-associated protein